MPLTGRPWRSLSIIHDVYGANPIDFLPHRPPRSPSLLLQSGTYTSFIAAESQAVHAYGIGQAYDSDITVNRISAPATAAIRYS